MLAANLNSRQTCFLLLDYPDNLHLAEMALPHASAPACGRLYIRMRDLSGGKS